MRITRNEEYSSELKQDIIKKYLGDNNRDTSKLHISDILNPRLSYFRKKYGNIITDQDVGFFIPGQAFHLFLQQIMGKEFAEKKLEFDGVLGTADYSGAFLAEIKTSRKYTIPDVPSYHYIEQLMKYMCMSGKLTAKLIVIFFTAGRTWKGDKASTLEIVCWDIDCTQKELDEQKNLISERKVAILETIQDNEFNRLPLCWDFMCFSAYKNKVTKVCPFYNECQPEDRYNVMAEQLCEELEEVKPKGLLQIEDKAKKLEAAKLLNERFSTTT